MNGLKLAVLILSVAACNISDATAPDNPPLTRMNLEASPAVVSNASFDEYGFNYQALKFRGIADGFDKNFDGYFNGSPVLADALLQVNWNEEMNRYLAEGGMKPPYDKAWYNNIWNDNRFFGSGFDLRIRLEWDSICLGIHLPEIVCVGDFRVKIEQGSLPGNIHIWIVKPNWKV